MDSQIIEVVCRVMVDSLYIGCAAVIGFHYLYKKKIDDLINRIDKLQDKQNVLYQSIVKIRNIVNIDSELTNDNISDINKIKKQIRNINNILKIEDIIDEDKEQTDEENEEDEAEDETDLRNLDDNYEEDTLSSEYTDEPVITLPLQNHITFPRFWIFNEKNFKQTKLSNGNYQLQFIGDDLRLISNELAKFLKVKSGTCMEFDDAYIIVYDYIQDHSILNISEDTKLSRLFNINENEDYEFSDSMLIKVLKKMLEPHFKKITYGCIINK